MPEWPWTFYLYQVSAHIQTLVYLANCFVEAASTNVERAFSRSGLTVSKMRHHLSDQSVRVATVLGSFASMPGVIPGSDIIAAFKDKSRRPKGKESDASSNAIVID